MVVRGEDQAAGADDVPSQPPAEIADPLLWRSAQPVLARHPATPPGEPCPECGAISPCPPRWLAERAIAVARDKASPAGLPQSPAGSGNPAPPVNGSSRTNGAAAEHADVVSSVPQPRVGQRRRPSPRPHRTVSA